jgi:hypothetical protein
MIILEMLGSLLADLLVEFAVEACCSAAVNLGQRIFDSISRLFS